LNEGKKRKRVLSYDEVCNSNGENGHGTFQDIIQSYDDTYA
jgi:hypothetical protein